MRLSFKPSFKPGTRWHVDGTPYSFANERTARAFALPGQTVVPVKSLPDPDEILEWDLADVAE
jgi:hypothetical protein